MLYGRSNILSIGPGIILLFFDHNVVQAYTSLSSRGFHPQKIPAQAMGVNKKISASWKFPTPPIIFLMVRP